MTVQQFRLPDLGEGLTEGDILKRVRLDALTRRLRVECPWDREQDERSIVPHTVEEAYELADAAHSGDDAKLVDELGDPATVAAAMMGVGLLENVPAETILGALDAAGFRDAACATELEVFRAYTARA